MTTKARQRRFASTGMDWMSHSMKMVLFCLAFIFVMFATTMVESSKTIDQPANQPDYTNATLEYYRIDCRHLKLGQYRCPPTDIDEKTQQPCGCNAQNVAPIICDLKPGLACDEASANVAGQPSRVRLAVQCESTNGYSFETALLLSIFLGMFGLDRLYLGYPAIALLKFCTLGFFFLGQFIDILLIALQVLGPADGSNYIIKAYGARMNIIQKPGLMPLSRPMLLQQVGDSALDLFFYPENVTFKGN